VIKQKQDVPEMGHSLKKNNITFFGLKIHTKYDNKTQIIPDFLITTASRHDIKIELCEDDERDYKDKAYFRKSYKQYNGVMMKALRNHPLNAYEMRRNNRISSVRSPCERPYSRMKNINGKHTKITTINRNEVMVTLFFMFYNIEQLIQLKRKADERFVLDEIEEIDEVDEMEVINEKTIVFSMFMHDYIYVT
jgi:IS5 family transposase